MAFPTARNPKLRDPNNTIVSFRLMPDMALRYWAVMDQVKARYPYISKSALHRELFGIVDPPEALSRADIAYVHTGKRKKAKKPKKKGQGG